MRRVVALAVACGAHAAVLGALGSVKLRPPALELSRPVATELDLDVGEPIRPTPAATARADRAARATPTTPASATAERSEPERPLVATAEVPRNGEEPPVEPPSSEWSFSSGPLRIDLRAAVTPDLVAPSDGRDARLDGQPRGSRTGGVAEGLAAQDVELGLGRGGPILAAVESAARGGDAPVEGNATFEALVFAEGAVLVHLVSADGDAEAWARVGESAAQSVPAGRVRVPPGTRGWRVVLRVEATKRLADGRSVHSLHGPRASVEPSVLQAMIEKKPGEEDPPPPVMGPPDDVGANHEPPPLGTLGPRLPAKSAGAVAQAIAQRVLPTPTLSASGKICSVAVSLTPVGVTAGGGCSPENIGAKTTRTVSGRILSEGAL